MPKNCRKKMTISWANKSQMWIFIEYFLSGVNRKSEMQCNLLCCERWVVLKGWSRWERIGFGKTSFAKWIFTRQIFFLYFGKGNLAGKKLLCKRVNFAFQRNEVHWIFISQISMTYFCDIFMLYIISFYDTVSSPK